MLMFEIDHYICWGTQMNLRHLIIGRIVLINGLHPYKRSKSIWSKL